MVVQEQSNRLKVLVTGAYGLIGNLVYAHLAAQPERYCAYGMAPAADLSARISPMLAHHIPDSQLREADLIDFAAIQRTVEGMDVVVHLAADPNGRSGWDSVLHSNIIGTQHVFEASRMAGVKRVIFASTNQVVFGYLAEEPYAALRAERYDAIDLDTFRPIQPSQPTRPLNEYAVSKVCGEALAHLYAYTYGMSCICLRIGWVTGDDQLPPPNDRLNARVLWCSQRDIVQVIERCINAPASLRFDVFFAASNNRYNVVDIQHTKDVLGYVPQDSAEERLK
jgi:nucleoside-diphosphate-sugar epimerase